MMTVITVALTLFSLCVLGVAFGYSVNMVNNVCLHGDRKKDPTYVTYAVGIFLFTVGVAGVMYSLLSSTFAYSMVAYASMGIGIILTLLFPYHVLHEFPKVHEQMFRSPLS